MSEPSREHVEAIDGVANVWVDGWSSERIALDILTSTDPAVLDAMQDALVRAGRLRQDEQWRVTGPGGTLPCRHRSAFAAEECATGDDSITYERRFVTGWREVTR